jgi:hypothetical protein
MAKFFVLRQEGLAVFEVFWVNPKSRPPGTVSPKTEVHVGIRVEHQQVGVRTVENIPVCLPKVVTRQCAWHVGYFRD